MGSKYLQPTVGVSNLGANAPPYPNQRTIKLFVKAVLLLLAATASATSFASGTEAPTRERPRTVEEKVRAAFPEAPEAMVAIARCESTLRQFNDYGTPLVSPTNDVGVMQINLAAHGKTAERLGIDIYAEDGNIAYARRLFEANGFRDWYMSARCHGYY